MGPEMTMELVQAAEALRGRRVLITGAGGFIGGRLAERLARECGVEVRALVRQFAGAVRLARFPSTILRGDVTDRAAVEAAVQGCDAVFHCAYGTSGSQRHRAWVNRVGTRRLLEASAAAGVRRFVHLSTLMVYGRTRDGDLTEEAPRQRLGLAYADSKLDAEATALAFARRGRLQTVVLQPTAVYGPYGGVWTERVLAAMRAGRVILVEGGSGFANHLYVDDLASAMLLAAVEPAAAGEALLVSSAEPATWREFYRRFERLLGSSRTVEMTAAEARATWRRSRRARPRALPLLLAALARDRLLRQRLFETREVRALRELAGDLLPEAWQQRIRARLAGGRGPAAPPPAGQDLPIQPMSPPEIEFARTRTRVRIDKARRLLGYEPAFDLDRGMELTGHWARWAGLAP